MAEERITLTRGDRLTVDLTGWKITPIILSGTFMRYINADEFMIDLDDYGVTSAHYRDIIRFELQEVHVAISDLAYSSPADVSCPLCESGHTPTRKLQVAEVDPKSGTRTGRIVALGANTSLRILEALSQSACVGVLSIPDEGSPKDLEITRPAASLSQPALSAFPKSVAPWGKRARFKTGVKPNTQYVKKGKV